MKKIFFLLFLVLMVGCSSNQEKKYEVSKNDVDALLREKGYVCRTYHYENKDISKLYLNTDNKTRINFRYEVDDKGSLKPSFSIILQGEKYSDIISHYDSEDGFSVGTVFETKPLDELDANETKELTNLKKIVGIDFDLIEKYTNDYVNENEEELLNQINSFGKDEKEALTGDIDLEENEAMIDDLR